MKKVLSTLFIALLCYCSFAQTNKLSESGNVGIGTTNPLVNLHVFANVSPVLAVQDNSSVLRFIPSNGINYIESGTNLSSSNADIRFTSMNGDVNWMSIQGSTGNVGIGTTEPQGYRLAVNGTIHSKEVKIDLINWPDYVFKPTYSLLSLNEVKSYVNKNHHLPDMPSEQEVSKEGVNLGEMNKLLVKKIEELTLYLIQQKEETDKKDKLRQQQINELKDQMARLTKRK